MKTIYLLRHAKSSWGDDETPDYERPLNGRGRRAAVLIGSWLEELGARPERLICSSARRAQETLDGIRVAWLADPVVRIEDELYLATAGSLLDRLRLVDDEADGVFVIGHNPGIHDIAVALAGSGDAAMLRDLNAAYPTAACCELRVDVERWGELNPGVAELRQFATPKLLV